MRFRVERDVLAEAVGWTAKSLPARPPVPVLGGVRIEAQTDDSVSLSCFDYEVSARSVISAEVEEPGVALVSGKLLADICRSLPQKVMEMTLEGTKVTITCGSANFTLSTMPVDDYPELPELPNISGTIDAAEFTKAVSQVTVASSKDETLPLLTGVRIEIEENKIALMATDRYRLAFRELEWKPAVEGMVDNAIVRGRTLSDVVKSLTSAGPIDIALNTEKTAGATAMIGFVAGGRRTTSLLIDGTYPPVRDLFPAEAKSHAVVNTAELTGAVKRGALVAERNMPIRLQFSPEGLLLQAGQGENAQASENIDANLYGEEIGTAFNPHYLLDGLAGFDTDYVRFSFTDPNKAVTLTGQERLDGPDIVEYKYLLMPLRFAQ